MKTMTKYRVRVEGIRLIEAPSPDEAAIRAALDARMMDTVATVLGEQEATWLVPNSTASDHRTVM